MKFIESYQTFNETVVYYADGTATNRMLFIQRLDALSKEMNMPDLREKFEMIEDHFLPFEKCMVRYMLRNLEKSHYFLVSVDMMDKNFDPKILDEDRIRMSYPDFEILKGVKIGPYGNFIAGNYAYIKFFV